MIWKISMEGTLFLILMRLNADSRSLVIVVCVQKERIISALPLAKNNEIGATHLLGRCVFDENAPNQHTLTTRTSKNTLNAISIYIYIYV